MLQSELIHPDILAALARAGHGSKVLIADGNYPASTRIGPHATLVSLNLSPGVVSGPQVLEALCNAIVVEDVAVMDYQREGPYALTEEPPIWSTYRSILQEHGYPEMALTPVEKWQFYDDGEDKSVCLTIQTAEQAIFANLILTIGVRK